MPQARSTLICFCFILGVRLPLCLAQSEALAEDPPFQNVYYYLDATTGKPIELERQPSSTDMKSPGLGLGGLKAVVRIPGATSSIRFPQGQRVEFVFAVQPNVDPRTLVQFYRLESKKDHREMVSAKGKPLTVGLTDRLTRDILPHKLVKYGPSSYKLIPGGDLAPGEYVFSTPNTSASFCFGIDGVKNGVRK